jgi:SAM-dependent MidA family methyltransferase
LLQTDNNASDGLGRELELPVPPQPARAHSHALAGLIRERIREEGGSISFERFMEMALYEPGLGYYSAGATRFGAAGDFITAPHVSPLYSHCLARQCRQVLAAMSGSDILELGAGSGIMAQDMLLKLEALDSLPERYLILETGADLRRCQQKLFSSRIPHLLPRITWLETLPEQPLSGVIIANEVVDALPVTRVALNKGELHELRVGHDGDDFSWIEAPCGDDRIAAAWEWIAAGLPMPLPDPYRTEINLRAGAWMRSTGEILKQGVMLLIDYGYPRHEYYHPQRDRGTLLCHYRHRSHEDPFFYPGLQDITASVDFSALAQVASEHGLRLAGYTSQGHFLIGCGLAEMVTSAQNGSGRPDPAVTGQVKRLTLPGEMGERFKAIAFTRNFTEPLIGFQFIDQQDKLCR